MILRNVIYGDKNNRWSFPVCAKNRKEATEMIHSFLLNGITDCLLSNLLNL